MSEEEFITFLDDKPSTDEENSDSDAGSLANTDSEDNVSTKSKKWKVFIVDDDEQVHVVTEFVLSDITIFERGIEFLHAYSAEESKAILAENPDIAVILLDVVMETDDAGLQLAKYIREEIKFYEPRIILRTGQPGYAPELDVITNYDINDYRTKSELTRNRLITAMIAAVRSYNQIKTISQSRAGLEKIVASAADLMERRAIEKFAEGVITQVASLFGITAEGILCARTSLQAKVGVDDYEIAGAAGRYSSLVNQPLDKIEDGRMRQTIINCFKQQKNLFDDSSSALFIHSSQHAAVIYVDLGKELEDLDKQLMEAFLVNISVAYENVKLFQRLKYIAFYDELTHLPNRLHFINELEAHREDNTKVVYLVDLDRFSDVNSSLGYSVGDQLLVAITERLGENLPEGSVFTRVGPDQFGLLVDTSVTEADIKQIFRQPFNVEGRPLIVSVTIGCCSSEHFEDGANTLKKVYIAVDRAKKSWTKKSVFFEQNLAEQVQRRLSLVNALKIAFEKQELELWYQPQVELSSGRVCGMEALIRWPQADGNFVPPFEFIPLAESSGLIVEIGDWIFNQAVEFAQSLRQNGLEDIEIGINVSVQQFKMDDFVAKVKKRIEELALDPGQITLELTESMAMDKLGFVRDALNDLRDYGFQVSLDDFGTEFSSLSQLKQVPFDHIKIDQSFLKTYQEPESQAVIEMILLLGKKLNCKTIAEGIETKEQERFVRECGCDIGQGWLYAKALPKSEMLEFIDKRNNNDAA